MNNDQQEAFEAWQEDYLAKVAKPNTTYDGDEFHLVIWTAAINYMQSRPVTDEEIEVVAKAFLKSAFETTSRTITIGKEWEQFVPEAKAALRAMGRVV